MKKKLRNTKFEEMKNKSFEIVRVTERLCEFCNGLINVKEQVLRIFFISNEEDYENLLTRSETYDRAEVDLQEGRIYFYDHDYPGEVHQRCLDSQQNP